MLITLIYIDTTWLGYRFSLRSDFPKFVLNKANIIVKGETKVIKGDVIYVCDNGVYWTGNIINIASSRTSQIETRWITFLTELPSVKAMPRGIFHGIQQSDWLLFLP